MKNRDLYLSQLIQFKDKPLIKVITGMRRCGKSSLLILFKDYLKARRVTESQIIFMNFESMEYESIKTHKDLYAYIKTRIKNKKKTYLLLDEIQYVSNWERAINSFATDWNVDIYITGSNAYLLSSDLSTLLSGRYVEIHAYPLSFKEYRAFLAPSTDSQPQQFQDYLEFGGLPLVTEFNHRAELIQPFLSGVINTVIVKDVVQRNEVRDVALLENVLRFIADNIGKPLSTKKISDYLNSAGRKVSTETIDNYLQMLEKAFIIYKAQRFDIKGKLFLKTLEKYYICDLGIRNHLLGLRNAHYGFVLENVIFFELLRRGYTVSIGKIGTLEVDFIAEKSTEKLYYQVSTTLYNEDTLNRELASLRAIPDQYPKTILTMDAPLNRDIDGVRIINIIDFLLS
jgi:predicted AAA+ superfamily ATPase